MDSQLYNQEMRYEFSSFLLLTRTQTLCKSSLPNSALPILRVHLPTRPVHATCIVDEIAPVLGLSTRVRLLPRIPVSSACHCSQCSLVIKGTPYTLPVPDAAPGTED